MPACGVTITTTIEIEVEEGILSSRREDEIIITTTNKVSGGSRLEKSSYTIRSSLKSYIIESKSTSSILVR